MERSLVYYVKGQAQKSSVTRVSDLEKLTGANATRTGFAWVERSGNATDFRLVDFLEGSMTLAQFDTFRKLLFMPVADVEHYLWVVMVAAFMLTLKSGAGRIDFEDLGDGDKWHAFIISSGVLTSGKSKGMAAEEYKVCCDFWKLYKHLVDGVTKVLDGNRQSEWAVTDFTNCPERYSNIATGVDLSAGAFMHDLDGFDMPVKIERGDTVRECLALSHELLLTSRSIVDGYLRENVSKIGMIMKMFDDCKYIRYAPVNPNRGCLKSPELTWMTSIGKID